MDFVCDLPRKQGFDSVLVIVCRLSKFVILVPCRKTDTARDTARRYLRKVFCRVGLPESIVSDKDPKFTAVFWRNLFRFLGSKLNFASAGHAQSDGQTERFVQTVSEAIRCVNKTGNDDHDWVEDLPFIEFALNNSVSAATNETPFMVDQGGNHVPQHGPSVLRVLS